MSSSFIRAPDVDVPPAGAWPTCEPYRTEKERIKVHDGYSAGTRQLVGRGASQEVPHSFYPKLGCSNDTFTQSTQPDLVTSEIRPHSPSLQIHYHHWNRTGYQIVTSTKTYGQDMTRSTYCLAPTGEACCTALPWSTYCLTNLNRGHSGDAEKGKACPSSMNLTQL